MAESGNAFAIYSGSTALIWNRIGVDLIRMQEINLPNELITKIELSYEGEFIFLGISAGRV